MKAKLFYRIPGHIIFRGSLTFVTCRKPHLYVRLFHQQQRRMFFLGGLET